MRIYTATMLLAASVWAALGQTDTAVGLWGALFVFSVLRFAAANGTHEQPQRSVK